MSRFKIGAFVAPFLMAATLASPADVRVYLKSGPPRAVVEHRSTAPGRGYVWVRGVHHWDGNAYVWTPGRWEQPPRAHARWRDGAWRHDRRQGWYWSDGGWR